MQTTRRLWINYAKNDWNLLCEMPYNLNFPYFNPLLLLLQLIYQKSSLFWILKPDYIWQGEFEQIAELKHIKLICLLISLLVYSLTMLSAFKMQYSSTNDNCSCSNTLPKYLNKGLRVNMGKRNVVICGKGLDTIKLSRKYPCSVCRKGVRRKISV